jgi:hypothetical protein
MDSQREIRYTAATPVGITGIAAILGREKVCILKIIYAYNIIR